MAKIKPGINSRRGSTRRIPATVIVHRTADRGSIAFEACVRVGGHLKRVKSGPGRAYAQGTECAFGKNPRAAVAKAMSRYATHLRKRKGAFGGYRKKRRR